MVQTQAEHNQSFCDWFQEYFGILLPLIWPSQWSQQKQRTEQLNQGAIKEFTTI